MTKDGIINITKLVTDDFVSSFVTDADCEGVFARLCVQYYPDALPEGVDPHDPRVKKILERIIRVQHLTRSDFSGSPTE